MSRTKILVSMSVLNTHLNIASCLSGHWPKSQFPCNRLTELSAWGKARPGAVVLEPSEQHQSPFERFPRNLCRLESVREAARNSKQERTR
jgi:hypothetical protein